MSKTVIEILKVYRELYTSDPESELTHLRADIDRALLGAPLDDEERALLSVLYLSEPSALPIRGKPDKNGGQSGRPPGGNTQAQVAALTDQDKTPAARENKTSRVLRKAAGKLSAYLGHPYE